MDVINTEAIAGIYGVLIVILLTIVIFLAVMYVLIEFGSFLEHANRKHRIDAMFLNAWDGSKTNELEAWHTVRHRLESQSANPQALRYVDEQIEECKRRQKEEFWSVKLPGKDGRPIIISNQN